MDILNSWKEIASYLGRGVRTAQRWERDLGLPVHRPKGRDRSAVLAFAHELEAWLQHTPVRSQLGSENARDASARAPLQNSVEGEVPPEFAQVQARVESSLDTVQVSLTRAHQLRAELVEAAHRQRDLTATLNTSLQKVTRSPRVRGTAA